MKRAEDVIKQVKEIAASDEYCAEAMVNEICDAVDCDISGDETSMMKLRGIMSVLEEDVSCEAAVSEIGELVSECE